MFHDTLVPCAERRNINMNKKNIIIQLYRFMIKILSCLANLLAMIQCKSKKNVWKELYSVYKPAPITFENIKERKIENDKKINLSFIIPVYNSEKFIQKCIESLVRQETKYEYEIILIDDGSTDASSSIIDEYAKRISYVHAYHQKNKGISVTRNRGITYARGEYIAFIDNDDFVSQYYVEILLNRAYEKDADMVKCGHYRWDVDKNSIMSTVKYNDASYDSDMGKKVLDYKGFVWEGITKRSIWETYRFPEGYWYEDMITRFVLMRKSKQIEIVEDVLYYYSIHSTNASRNVWNRGNIKCLDEIYLIKNMLDLQINMNEKMISHALIYELGGVLWSRTRKLPSELKKCVFLAGREILKKNMIANEHYTKDEQQMIRAFEQKSYLSWKLLSCVEMLKVKLKNEYDINL